MVRQKMMKPKEPHPADWSMESILQALELDRLAGHLPGQVSNASIRYGVDPDNSSTLLAYTIEGTRVVSVR